MADGFSKTIAFVAMYCEELVQLQKPTLEALLKSNRAKQVKEWNAATTLGYRKVSTLAAEHKDNPEDWEFVRLCDMSTLSPHIFTSRLQRCFEPKPKFSHAACRRD